MGHDWSVTPADAGGKAQYAGRTPEFHPLRFTGKITRASSATPREPLGMRMTGHEREGEIAAWLGEVLDHGGHVAGADRSHPACRRDQPATEPGCCASIQRRSARTTEVWICRSGMDQ